MRKLRLLAIPFALVLGLSACGGDEDGSSAGEGGSGSHNDADVSFAQSMIPHHTQAVEMAELASTRAASAEVKSLASRIEQAQGPEIETMRNWLSRWGEDESDSGMDHGGSSGMMSDDEMSELDGLSGAEFDEQFLLMMKEHHEGAIEMAETEVEDGRDRDALALAQDIIETQTKEIEEIDRLLKAL